jgi:hypothetical protein
MSTTLDLKSWRVLLPKIEGRNVWSSTAINHVSAVELDICNLKLGHGRQGERVRGGTQSKPGR